MSTQLTCVHKKIYMRENMSWTSLVACQFATKQIHLSRSKTKRNIQTKILLVPKIMLIQTPLRDMWVKHKTPCVPWPPISFVKQHTLIIFHHLKYLQHHKTHYGILHKSFPIELICINNSWFSTIVCDTNYFNWHLGFGAKYMGFRVSCFILIVLSIWAMRDSSTHLSIMLDSYGSPSFWYVILLSSSIMELVSRIDLNNDRAIVGSVATIWKFVLKALS